MSTQIQRRRGSTSQHSSFTGALGEITVDTDKNTAVVHDGVTPGGSPLAKELGSVTGNADRKHFSIGCIPRCTAGVFSLLDDAGHHPLNISGVSQPDSTTVRVTYAKTASKINSFVVGADDVLCKHGVISGGDVGNTYANIKSAAPLSFFVSGAGAVTNPSLWGADISAAVASNVITVTHPAVGDTNDPVIVTPINGAITVQPMVAWSGTTVEIRAVDDMNGYISYNGSSWVWNTSLSNNVNSPTAFTWTASNTLKVEHADTTPSFTVTLTSHQGALIPVIENIAGTYFEVGFYDWAGVKQTVQSTNMKFWYRRNAKVHSKMPAAAQFSVRRGYALVPVANFSNVAGNNFWVAGDMEEA